MGKKDTKKFREYLKGWGFTEQKDVKDEAFEDIKKKGDKIKGGKIVNKKF